MGCGASTPAAKGDDAPTKKPPSASAAASPGGAGAAAEDAVEKLVPDGHVIFMLGGPGAGKGTQCARLVEKYGAVHISSADELRKAIRSDSPQGVRIADMIKQGQIVPARVVVGLLLSAMKATKGPYLIDGFPRSADNLALFEELCGPPTLTLNFSCSEEVCEARLLQRSETSGRTDDNPETIKRRFRAYTQDTVPVITSLTERSLVTTVDAAKTEDEVFAASCAALDALPK